MLLERNRLKKVFLNFSHQLSKLLGKEVENKIISDVKNIEVITNKVFYNIKRQQELGKSLKFISLPEAINILLEYVSSLNSSHLLLIIWKDESHCIVELEITDVLTYLAGLWELSEGDLIVSLPNLSKGCCLEFNHYYDKDEYEVTIW